MSVVGGSGFTLIELVMVIVISAVIAAVAIPWPQSFGIVKL
jgi:prepilin-type N-terminal cleavage/methylation domain-containing protein